MYFVMIVLLMAALPIASMLVEALMPGGADWVVLAGKWFTFWAVGARLLIAGIRQSLNPAFTAKDIFNTDDAGAARIVTELGSANLCLGLAGLLSLAFSAWVPAAALAGGLYLGLAGLVHARHPHRDSHETWAMVSDLFVFAVLAIFLVVQLARGQLG